MFRDVPKKYHPAGFELLFEDQDIIVGNKAPGLLTVAAQWNRDRTVHAALNEYVRKGSAKSRKEVFVVHRLDQDTSGVLIFAKTEAALNSLKNAWPTFSKTYLAVVHRHPKEKKGTISSYLKEDELYKVHSSSIEEAQSRAVYEEEDPGKLATTDYEVLAESPKFSLLKVNLKTGRKNQIRVHLAELGHPVVGDKKYGPKEVANRDLMLHAWKLEINHPFNKKRLSFVAQPPRYLQVLVPWDGYSGAGVPEQT